MTSDGLTIDTARPGDEPALRALLRRKEMGGRIRLTFEREPNHGHAAAVEGERHHIIVAKRAMEPGDTGEIVGMASRAVRKTWVNGEPRLVGYLAQLRRVQQLKGGRRLLQDGFAALAQTRRDDELPADLTSIVADNSEARRLLERGLPGLPTYRRLCRYRTLTFATSARRATGRAMPASAELLPAIADCLERNLRRYQFAPVWTRADLEDSRRCRDLAPEDFFVVKGGDRVKGCVAIWDQRRFKQVVVRGYAGLLGRARPVLSLLNLGLTLTRRPRLPSPGEPLRLAFLSHLAVDDDDPATALDLVATARAAAARRGLAYLSLGLAARHPLADLLRRRTKARVLESLIYLVGPPLGFALDDRCPHLEAAVL